MYVGAHQRLCKSLLFLVLVAPTINDLLPREQTVTQTMGAIFTCSATGRPRPTIQWYREISGSRTLLPDGQSNEIMSGTREISSILTIDLTSPSDAAEYVCVASNIVSVAEMTASLTVHGKVFYAHTYHTSDSCLLPLL